MAEDALKDVLPFVIGHDRADFRKRVAGKALGPDGIWRSAAEEEQLNTLFNRAFSTESGREVLKHLKQITLARVCGPEATEAQLRHIEGQRFLVSVILNRIERGKGK